MQGYLNTTVNSFLIWNTVFVYFQIPYLNKNIAKVKVYQKYSDTYKTFRITKFDLILPDKLIFALVEISPDALFYISSH